MRFLESVYFQEIIILVLDYSQVTSKKKQKKSDNGDFSIDESSRPKSNNINAGWIPVLGNFFN